MVDRQDASTARWQLFVSAAAIGIVVGSALLGLLLNVNALRDTASNLTDRAARLESLVDEPRARPDGFATEMPALRRSLTEVQTRFCASAAVRNMMHANDLRVLAVLWFRLIGGELPTRNAYYPFVGRCKSPFLGALRNPASPLRSSVQDQVPGR